MRLKFLEYSGKQYIVPEGFEFNLSTISHYKNYCGAGESWGEKLIPDRIGGKKVSHI